MVNLLVVIGESSIAEHSQAITASLPGMLPRLLPAPQALLKPSRPARMPATLARMTGVYSGATLDSVGFFANIITPLDDLPAFSFKVLDIKHAELSNMRPVPPKRGVWSRTMGMTRRQSRQPDAEGQNEPDRSDARRPHPDGPRRQVTVQFTDTTLTDKSYIPSGLKRRTTAKEHAQDLLTSPTVAVGGQRPAVPAKIFSPIHILSIFSCLLSIGLIGLAASCQDGTAILAIALVSLASTVVGYASFWRPILMKRKHTNEVPPGDVLIRTRAGAFVLVRCSEEVARELYAGTEECEYYVSGNAYRALMALGTMMLMISVVLLGNCTWEPKVAIGASYILLNGLYWGLGMIPRQYFWDLSRYEWHDVTPTDAGRADVVTDEGNQREGHPSFTRTLWYAIRETKLVGWVERSGAAPSTDQWKAWLREAEKAALAGDRDWPAVERKDAILKEELRRGEIFDAAMEAAPAEIRPPPQAPWFKDGTF